MSQSIESQVECHAGHTYAQRPRAFTWQGQRLHIDEVTAEWRTPGCKVFQVRCQQQLFQLEYDQQCNTWHIHMI